MTILNTTHYNKIPPFLEYTLKGPLPKQYANMFNHFIKAETLKLKIVRKTRLLSPNYKYTRRTRTRKSPTRTHKSPTCTHKSPYSFKKI